MRIIKPSTVRQWARGTPRAAPFLEHWLALTEAAEWANFVQVRGSFPHADTAVVGSGRTVVIFNVARTGFRLIVAVHYDRRIVFTLLFLSHTECERDRWKESL